MDFETILSHPLVQIAIIVVLAIVAHKFGSTIVDKLTRKVVSKHEFDTPSDKKKRGDTLSGIFRAAVGVIVWLIAVGAILGALDFDLAQVAAGAGFLGIIVGLGAQATIRDYLAGIFILMENQYRVGDIVTLGVNGETSGVVEDITLRITKLRDLDGTLHIVRNGEANVITNRTFKYSSVVIDVGVAYDSDIDLVEKTMDQVGEGMMKDEELAKVIKEPIKFFRVDSFGDSAVIIKVVGKVIPAKQWDMAGEYRRRLLKEFNKKGIEIAFPQVVVHQAKPN